jgi:TRAP-type C4-dicarboxylate transport system permease large subunit
MDVVASLIILGPILAPVMLALGVNPIHFGIITTVNLSLALVTPPVGGCLFVASGIAKITMESLIREVLPFIVVAIVLLALITFIPSITLYIPGVLGLA